MIILDGCCGAGGAARGYVSAGHVVYGVDTQARLREDYLKSGASDFLVMDILEALASPWIAGVDFVHCSPPCQRYSRMTRCRPGLAENYPDLIGPVRDLMIASGKPFIIENVEGAPLRNPVTLCGAMVDNGGEYLTYRHRWFEAGGGFTLAAPPAPPEDMPGVRKSCGWPHRLPAARAGHWKPGCAVSVSGHERRGPVNAAMAIDWMSDREDVAEAIPPFYTEWIGRQIGG